jgi:hypothetical protein
MPARRRRALQRARPGNRVRPCMAWREPCPSERSRPGASGTARRTPARIVATSPRPAGAPARVATATAQYKRQLDALFDRGEVPDHLKDKLPAPDAAGGDPESKERVRLTRAVRHGGERAGTREGARRAAREARRRARGPGARASVPGAPEGRRAAEALSHIEHAVALGNPLPKTSRKTFVTRLDGITVTSFDPRVQARAAALVAKLR